MSKVYLHDEATGVTVKDGDNRDLGDITVKLPGIGMLERDGDDAVQDLVDRVFGSAPQTIVGFAPDEDPTRGEPR